MVSLKNGVGLLCVAALLSVGACQESEGPLEKTGKAIDEGMEDVGDSMEDAGDEMEDKARGR